MQTIVEQAGAQRVVTSGCHAVLLLKGGLTGNVGDLLLRCLLLPVSVLARHVDCDVVMAEVRETSRKPDEMYPLLERLSPGTRKLEIFARPHNVRPGWVSMGNQLGKQSCASLVRGFNSLAVGMRTQRTCADCCGGVQYILLVM